MDRIKTNKKVCIIGLDGVSPKFFNILLGSLSLTGISTISNKGFVSSYISIPPYTPSAWTSIFTGVNPGKHSIYGFYKVSKNDNFHISLATSYDVKYPRIFEMLSLFNLRSVVINVPLVYPIHGLIGSKNVVLVSDWASPQQFIYPKQYENRYKEYLINPPHMWYKVTDLEDYIKSVESFLETRLNLYYEFLEKENFNLFIIVFSELDWLSHKIPSIILGTKLHYIYRILSLIDGFIRKAIDCCDLVICVSDHGFRIAKVFVSVNRILADKGFFVYRLGKILHSQHRSNTRYINEDHLRLFHSFLFDKVYPLIREFIPPYLLRRLESLLLGIDYNTSIAFMLEVANWGVYVERGWHDIVREVFTKNIFIKKVLTKNHIFWGSYVDRAPDLILIPKDHVFFDGRVYSKSIYTNYTGEHDPYAFLAIYSGDTILNKSIAMRVSMYDIVPTVLAYLGLPIPHDTDGKVLTEILPFLPHRYRKFNYLQRFKILRKIKMKFI